jgi:enoyl-CoA hydratase/carnithine racemase
MSMTQANAACRAQEAAKETVVLFEQSDGIATMTLNRPDKLNALNYAIVDRLSALLDEIEQDDSIRVVILTGAGRAFSAGADIAEFSGSVRRGVETALREFVHRGQALTARIEAFPKPIIAAVNGLAFGGGCEIMEATALAIASERATFAKPEIRLGMPPTFGGTQRLPRLVGRKRALKMLLDAESIAAEEAQAFGLINDVVPHDQLLPAAKKLAARIMQWSPVAVTACLRAATRGLNVSIQEGLAIEASQFAVVAATQDLREGTAAFLQKRPARFRGA